MKKHGIAFLIILCCGALFLQSTVFAAASKAEQFEQKYAQQREQLSKQQFDSNQEYEAEYNRIALNYRKELFSTPEIVWEKLSEQQPDTPKNRTKAKEYLYARMQQTDYQDSLLQYYADSQHCTVDQLRRIPEFSCSEPIPLSDREDMLIYGKGLIDAAYFIQYVKCWMIVGYADGNPFAVFQLSADDEDAYSIDSVYPSPKQAAAYESLLTESGCYAISSIIEDDVTWYLIKDGDIAAIRCINAETGQQTVFLEDVRQIAVYHRALYLAMSRNLDIAFQENQKSIALKGNYTESSSQYISYKDMWNRAKFDLYIKPYLLPAVCGIVLAAVLNGILIFRKRRLKS